MARIESSRRRLENWGRWCQERAAGGLGYSRTNVMAHMAGVDNWGNDDAHMPTDNIEASQTDDAVRSLQFVRSHLYLTLTLYYAKGFPIDQVAREMCRCERTIKHNLDEADHAIDRWFRDRSEVRAKLALAVHKISV